MYCHKRVTLLDTGFPKSRMKWQDYFSWNGVSHPWLLNNGSKFELWMLEWQYSGCFTFAFHLYIQIKSSSSLFKHSNNFPSEEQIHHLHWKNYSNSMESINSWKKKSKPFVSIHISYPCKTWKSSGKLPEIFPQTSKACEQNTYNDCLAELGM